MNPIRQFLKKTMSAVVPQRLFLVHGTPQSNVSKLQNCQSTGSNRPTVNVSFTFDDGPHPEYTPQLLDLLSEYQQRGTFFVIGEKAQKYPKLIERIINEGHEIGNHTFTHGEPFQTSTRHFLDEIKQTDQIINQITGFSPNLVRPPNGKLTVRKTLRLWLLRRSVVLWDKDPHDYSMTGPTEMLDWCQHYEPLEGNIILLHDNHRFAIEAVSYLSERQDIQIQSRIVSHWLSYKSDQDTIDQRPCA